MGLGFTDSFKVKKEGPFFEWILFEVDTFFVDTDHWGKFCFGAQCHTNVTHTNVFFMSSVCPLKIQNHHIAHVETT